MHCLPVLTRPLDPNDPHKNLYDVDDESTIISLSDWYHFASPLAPIIGMTPSCTITTERLMGFSVFFNSTLINGKGRYIDAFGENLTNELAVVNVKKGTRYRMRLVSMSCDPVRSLQGISPHLTLIVALQNYAFSIDNHHMTIIEGK